MYCAAVVFMQICIPHSEGCEIMAEQLLDGHFGCRHSILPGTLAIPDEDMVQHVVADAAHTVHVY